ncbi:hypothetical protein [Maribacter sp. 2307ULW6-5]|uniref:hypothetical protein n=1 Tax=Maribacter sp. 2307ULW6-5 TaxID=3386275 RepID=UPI0039BCE7B4
MKTVFFYLLTLFLLFLSQHLVAQEEGGEPLALLEKQKQNIIKQEKEALKIEVEEINKRLEKGSITMEKAQELKKAAAEKRALNIEDRVAIIDNRIRLLNRNGSNVLELDTLGNLPRIQIDWGSDDGGDRLFGMKMENINKNKKVKYDRRTYSDFVWAAGLNNAIIDGRSLQDTPYKVGGSRFFEMGWQWRTRVFKNSNFLRLNYGVSFQFNGLKPKDNQYFVIDADGQAQLEEFSFDLDKSKFRTDNLVFPVHFEFGPSKKRQTDESIRYSLSNQFRFGLGGYGGINLGARQKLKYDRNGDKVKDKLKRGYNTNDFVYGLSAYAGFDSILLYLKYDLNPIFGNAEVAQRNVSLGLRFDL